MTTVQVAGPDFGWPTFQWVQRRLFAEIDIAGSKLIHLDLSSVGRAYPNGVIPLIVLVEQYRQQKHIKFELTLPSNERCQRTFIDSNWAGYLAPAPAHPVGARPNALHRFTDDTALNDLINSQIRQILGTASYAPGVLQSFEWALNEVAGNVLVHSEQSTGWIQVLVHPSTHHMAIVVADGGVGIPEPIRKAFPAAGLTRDEDAISYALREGITSKPEFGQGKGLTGTLEIVKINAGGRMSVHSRSGLVEWNDDRLAIKGDFPPFPGTMVDIQLNINQPIDIETALWGAAPGYPFNEALFGRDAPAGMMRLKLAEQASGFGNRVTGQKIRHTIENLLAAAPGDVLEIDFSGVELMASSFADEVFGKLAVSLGFVGFSSRLRFTALNKFCQGIIDDVVQSRIVQSRSGNGNAK